MKIKIDFKNKSCTWLLYKVTTYDPEVQYQLNKHVGKHSLKRIRTAFRLKYLQKSQVQVYKQVIQMYLIRP